MVTDEQPWSCSWVFSTSMLSFLHCYCLEKGCPLKARGENGGCSLKIYPFAGCSISQVACATHSSYIEEFYWSIRVRLVLVVNN